MKTLFILEANAFEVLVFDERHLCFVIFQEIIRRVKDSSNYFELLEHDQLRKTRNRKEAYVGFCK